MIQDRSYLPADPELDGKALPTGFSVAINPTPFTNKVTQVAQGGRAKVRISPALITTAGRPAWDRDFLVVEETLPAGTTLIDGSVQTSASSYTLADGVLTFYFSPEVGLGPIQYEVSGYLPGRYRSLPTRIRGAYDPGVVHLGAGRRPPASSPPARRDRPLQGHARRALRPGQGPLPSGPARRGRRAPRGALRRLHA